MKPELHLLYRVQQAPCHSLTTLLYLSFKLLLRSVRKENFLDLPTICKLSYTLDSPR